MSELFLEKNQKKEINIRYMQDDRKCVGKMKDNTQQDLQNGDCRRENLQKWQNDCIE